MPITKNITVKVPVLGLQARMMPESLNEETRTVELVWTTGKKGLRSGWEGNYYEELKVSNSSVDLSRLNAGAPLLNNHSRYNGLDGIHGVVEKAWITKGEGRALVRFAQDEKSEEIYQKVKDGIIKNVSVGYRVTEYKDVSKKGDEVPTYRAENWTPFEISLVDIPFDENSQVRNLSNDENDCIITRELTEVTPMPEKQKEIMEPKAPVLNKEEIRAEVMAEEKTRVMEIMTSVRTAKLSVEFAEKLITENVSVESARGRIIDELAKNDSKVETKTARSEVMNNEIENKRSGMTDAILHRGGIITDLSDNARRFRSMSLLDMARTYHNDSFSVSKDTVIERAFHSSSDFSALLMDAANKSLQKEYGEYAQTFEPIVRRTSLSDFKKKNVVRLGDAPKLKKLNDQGEIEKGTLSESKESYSLDTYARGIKIGRKTIINDDLDALTRMPAMFGRRVRELEGDLVYDLLLANPVMGDGNKLFSANHKNKDTGAVISVASIGKAWLSIRKQKGLDGSRIDIRPRFLVVPVALEAAALQFVNTNYTATKQDDVNIYAGRLQVIADPRLDDTSATNWYLMGSTDQIDLMELATLDGNGPMFHSEEKFATGVTFEIAHDLGVGLIDHRGYYGNGAFA